MRFHPYSLIRKSAASKRLQAAAKRWCLTRTRRSGEFYLTRAHSMDVQANTRNKAYQRIRNWLSLVGIFWTLAMLLIAIYGGLSRLFSNWEGGLAGVPYLALFWYFLIFSIYSMLFSFPLSFFSGYTLEHRFALSNQRLSGWFIEWGKRQILSFLISAALVLALYGLI